jgi:hypothetical protein
VGHFSNHANQSHIKWIYIDICEKWAMDVKAKVPSKKVHGISMTKSNSSSSVPRAWIHVHETQTHQTTPQNKMGDLESSANECHTLSKILSEGYNIVKGTSI